MEFVKRVQSFLKERIHAEYVYAKELRYRNESRNRIESLFRNETESRNWIESLFRNETESRNRIESLFRNETESRNRIESQGFHTGFWGGTQLRLDTS